MATQVLSGESSHFGSSSSSGLRRTKSSQSALYAAGSPTLAPRTRSKQKSSVRSKSKTNGKISSSKHSDSKHSSSKSGIRNNSSSSGKRISSSSSNLSRSSPALYQKSKSLVTSQSASSSLSRTSPSSSSSDDEDDNSDVDLFTLNRDEIHVPIYEIDTTNIILDPESHGPPPSPQGTSPPLDYTEEQSRRKKQKEPEVINVVKPNNAHNTASKAEDDLAAVSMPSRQVDYLSHEWREEEIWASWSYIVARRKQFGERSRLENASWRSWAKQRNKLNTISPKKLNW
jgi:hypothetical protein